LVCLLLCLLAWRGPIPIVHSHQTGFDGSAVAEHLDRYHEAGGGTPWEWHFHVMLWQDILPACPTEQYPVPGPHVGEPQVLAGACIGSSLVAASEAAAWVRLPWIDAVRGQGEAAPGGHPAVANFLSSQLLARPACAVLSVSRC